MTSGCAVCHSVTMMCGIVCVAMAFVCILFVSMTSDVFCVAMMCGIVCVTMTTVCILCVSMTSDVDCVAMTSVYIVSAL